MRLKLAVALAFAAGATACNNGTISHSIPPIAGVVGGPDQNIDESAVAMEITSDAASAVPGTTIKLSNRSRTVDDDSILADSPYVTLSVKGNVGDDLRVELTHPTEGVISRNFVIPRVRIFEVRDPLGPDPVIYAGAIALLIGEGFSTGSAPGFGNTIEFDGVAVAITNTSGRPGTIYFKVPPTAAVGDHEVVMSVAETLPGQFPQLTSEPFTVTVTVSP